MGRLPELRDRRLDGLSIDPEIALAPVKLPLDLPDPLVDRRDPLRIAAELLERRPALLASPGGEDSETLELGAAHAERLGGALDLALQLAHLAGELLEAPADPEESRLRKARLEQQIHAPPIARPDLLP